VPCVGHPHGHKKGVQADPHLVMSAVVVDPVAVGCSSNGKSTECHQSDHALDLPVRETTNEGSRPDHRHESRHVMPKEVATGIYELEGETTGRWPRHHGRTRRRRACVRMNNGGPAKWVVVLVV
jgi:hypothetical protein